MNLLPALLVQAFALAVVNGGLSSVTLNPFTSFGSFDEFWLNVKCIHGAVDKTMDESNVDDLWHDVKIKMNAIIDIEWKNCMEISDPVGHERCKIIVIEHAAHVSTKFVTQLLDDHKLNLDWQKLRSDIAAKCFREQTLEESKQQ